MNSIKGTSTYWKTFKSEVAAMVKQLGVPTFFVTLSCAHLRLTEIIQKLSKVDQADVDKSNLSYHERCSLLDNNLLTVARQFQCGVEGFF